jgi:imidazolonepropionase-like amidohydrolase
LRRLTTPNYWRSLSSADHTQLGVVEEGALTDLLLMNGDPIASVNLIADPASNVVLIMKDVRIHKNSLGEMP